MCANATYIKGRRGQLPQITLSRDELHWLLTQGGYSEADIARQVNVSREAVRQKVGRSLVEIRTAEWYAIRCGHPEMADKQWLEAALREAKGARKLARQLGLSHGKIVKQAGRLGINKDICSSFSYTERVEAECAVCHSLVRRTRASVRGQAVLCGRKCFAIWIQEVVWPRRREATKKAQREETQRRLNAARAARHAA